MSVLICTFSKKDWQKCPESISLFVVAVNEFKHESYLIEL